MVELRTEIEINASPQRVWSVLTDFASYKDWNPLLIKAKGQAVVGQWVPMVIKPPIGLPAPMRMKILIADPERELCWRGALPVLIAGEHWFRIERLGENRVRLLHGERFSGLIPKIVGPVMLKPLKGAYVMVNEALKARAESGA